jgi:hypothetical protein
MKEYKAFKFISKSMKSSFLNGLPRFLDPSAHALQYDPYGSSIFVVDYHQFVQMSPTCIQTIFHNCHILVTDVQGAESLDFDLGSLSMVGSLHREMEVQGEIIHILPYISLTSIYKCCLVGELKGNQQGNNILKETTLYELHRYSRQSEPPIVNALDLPMGGISVDPPPNYG